MHSKLLEEQVARPNKILFVLGSAQEVARLTLVKETCCLVLPPQHACQVSCGAIDARGSVSEQLGILMDVIAYRVFKTLDVLYNVGQLSYRTGTLRDPLRVEPSFTLIGYASLTRSNAS